jgi:peptidyl-prolyl cis-trans isomerase C
MMVREFDEVVFSAAVNTVQGPVKTQFGYHLLEVTSRRD